MKLNPLNAALLGAGIAVVGTAGAIDLPHLFKHDEPAAVVAQATPPQAGERERVFDRFFRRAGADEEGSGLGLAIVRSVAERHGAELRLDGSPSGGLRATVRFPAEPAS